MVPAAGLAGLRLKYSTGFKSGSNAETHPLTTLLMREMKTRKGRGAGFQNQPLFHAARDPRYWMMIALSGDGLLLFNWLEVAQNIQQPFAETSLKF
jgi:hypothetical protein